MIHMFFAEEASASGIGALGVSLSAFIIQLVTFFFVFLLLKRFAFKPIIALLEKRRQVIEDGIKLGEKMEKERDRLQEEEARIIRDARHQADRIIETGHKEARDIIREAEKGGQKRVEAMVKDAEARIKEDTEQAGRKLEKDIVGLVAEATETIVGEKVDVARDSELIDKAIKKNRKPE